MPSQTALFLAALSSKMAGLFGQLNFLYLNSMMSKRKYDQINTPQVLATIKNAIADASHQNNVTPAPNFEQAIQHSEKQICEKSDLKGQKKDENEGKSSKSTKIVVAPTPPASSYILFFKDHRQKILNTYPHYGPVELTKVAAQCWKQLSAEQKQPYQEKFLQQKNKYYEQMKIFNSLNDQQKCARKQKKRGRKTKQQKQQYEKLKVQKKERKLQLKNRRLAQQRKSIIEPHQTQNKKPSVSSSENGDLAI